MAVMQHLKFKRKNARNWNKVSQSICNFLLAVMGVLRYEIPSLIIYHLNVIHSAVSQPPHFFSFCLTCCVIVMIHLLLSVERFSLQKESDLAHVSGPIFFPLSSSPLRRLGSSRLGRTMSLAKT